MVAQQQ